MKKTTCASIPTPTATITTLSQVIATDVIFLPGLLSTTSALLPAVLPMPNQLSTAAQVPTKRAKSAFLMAVRMSTTATNVQDV